MWRHWLNEILNMLAGNRSYVQYPAPTQWLLLLAVLALVLLPLLLGWL